MIRVQGQVACWESKIQDATGCDKMAKNLASPNQNPGQVSSRWLAQASRPVRRILDSAKRLDVVFRLSGCAAVLCVT